MLTGGDEILARVKPAQQWRRAGIRGKDQRKRKHKRVRKVVLAIELAEVPRRKGKYF